MRGGSLCNVCDHKKTFPGRARGGRSGKFGNLRAGLDFVGLSEWLMKPERKPGWAAGCPARCGDSCECQVRPHGGGAGREGREPGPGASAAALGVLPPPPPAPSSGEQPAAGLQREQSPKPTARSCPPRPPRVTGRTFPNFAMNDRMTNAYFRRRSARRHAFPAPPHALAPFRRTGHSSARLPSGVGAG